MIQPKHTFPSLLTISILAINCATYAGAEDEKDGWVNLVKGDSLELWEAGPSKAKSKEIGDRWSLKDGVVRLDRDAKKGNGGQIWTKKKYYDFDLKFEFNISHGGNSGVKYRTADVKGSALGCEYQVLDDVNHSDNKNPTHLTACLYELVTVPADRKLNPPGQWNTGRIRVSNNRFEHWLNGVKVVSIEYGSDDWKKRFAKSKYKGNPDFAKFAGPILLQDHQDTVSYRNIFVRELIAKPKDAAVKKNKTIAVNNAAEPLAFTTNCKVCHVLDRTTVGPSLVEISDLYPRDNRDKFVKWCISPGRERGQMDAMPAMAHIPEPQLIEIYDYIKKVTVGIKRVKVSRLDPYAAAPAKTKRPRIERTFVPESGPASLIIALPTSKKHNVIWDTDQCRLRYISVGEPDNYPYLRSNGNSLAKVGKIIYRESVSIFKSAKAQYKGYHLSKDGYPSFVYRIGESEVTETISVVKGAIVRSFEATPSLPAYQLPENGTEVLAIVAGQAKHTITVTYTSK